jgi:hypothetical protein
MFHHFYLRTLWLASTMAKLLGFACFVAATVTQASTTTSQCVYTSVDEAAGSRCAEETDASALESFSGFADGCRAVEGVPCSHVIGLSGTSCRHLCDANAACSHAYFSPASQGGFPAREEQDKCVLYSAAPATVATQLDGTKCYSKGACVAVADELPDLVPNAWKALGGADMCVGGAYQKDMATTAGVAWASNARMMCTVQSAQAACVADVNCAGFVRGFVGADGSHECYFLTHDQISDCTAHYAHLQGPHSHQANGYVLVREHPYTTCNYGVQFQSKPPTAVSDRECSPITPCDTTAQFESVAPARTSDRVCTPLTTCDTAAEYAATEATTTSNRVCAALSTCDYATQWRSLDATPSSDRVCEPLTTCGAGEGMTSGPTQVSDRACAPCAGEFDFKADAGNTACSTCPYGYKAAAGKQSCYVYMCSHTFCKQEEHHCTFGSLRKHRAKSQYNSWTAASRENCDGRTFKSIRVYHHGLETNCLSTGHQCSMGALSGDKSKCECGPSSAPVHMLLPYETATVSEPDMD